MLRESTYVCDAPRRTTGLRCARYLAKRAHNNRRRFALRNNGEGRELRFFHHQRGTLHRARTRNSPLSCLPATGLPISIGCSLPLHLPGCRFITGGVRT